MSHLDAPYLSAWGDVLTSATGDARQRLNDVALPTRRMEDWRFIKLNGLERTAFERATTSEPRACDRDAIAAQAYDGSIGRIVFVNGVLDEANTTWPKGEGVTINRGASSLGEITQQGFEQDHFALLNEVLADQTVNISVARDTFVAGAVHVLFVNSSDVGKSSHPRVHIQMGRGSKVSVVEEHLGFGDQAHWTNVVVEASLEDNARLNHVKLQRENTHSFHTARTSVRLHEGAHYASMTASFGGILSRHDLWADIKGGNTTCELHGLAVVGERQVADTHSTMNHDHPHSLSDQLHKCIVDDRAHAVFNGKIVVQQVAQQINAFQLNRNLLLSNTAKIDTKPQLEIFADDVKCSHGATIGQLDEDQVFYLGSRGIAPDDARILLTYAFAAELVNRVPVLAVRQTLESLIADHIRSK